MSDAESKHDHEFGVHCRPACPRWLNPEPQADWEPQQDWYFTFGANHTHPETGQRLGQSCVRIHGTYESTRYEMFAAFGNQWAFQYSPDEKPMKVDRWNLVEAPMPRRDFAQDVAGHLARLEAERPVNQPVTPAEERTEDVSGPRVEFAAEVTYLDGTVRHAPASDRKHADLIAEASTCTSPR